METINDKPPFELTSASLNNLDTTRKWTLFISILGFILLGILVIFGFSLGFFLERMDVDTDLAPFPYFLFGFIYLLFGVIYFFPILYLYKFSINAKRSIVGNDSALMAHAFRFLRDHYIYIGVLMAIGTVIYVLSAIKIGIIGLLTL